MGGDTYSLCRHFTPTPIMERFLRARHCADPFGSSRNQHSNRGVGTTFISTGPGRVGTAKAQLQGTGGISVP